MRQEEIIINHWLKGWLMADYFVKGKLRINWWVLVPCLILVVLGAIMVFSASSYNAQKTYGNSMYFANKQIVGAVLGVGALVFFYFFNYNFLKKIKYYALALGVIALCIVFIPGIGIESYGAKRWIGFGSFSFQASEIAKFCFIIFCAGFISDHEKINTFRGLLPILISGLVMCFLIMLEPNMSITICFAALMVVMLLVGGMKIKHLCLLLLPALVLIPILILI